MATTTNYSWTTPDDTDLVKDGAAAIRTLGSSADTTVKNLNPGTTAGDIDYYTSGTAKARIAIGTAGQILQVNSGATAPEWATPAGGGKVLQVVQASTTTETTVASLTYVDSNLSATITPSAATSKILILVNQQNQCNRSNTSVNGAIDLLRASTPIYNQEYALGLNAATGGGSVNLRTYHNAIYLDSPNTTSATIYKTRGKVSSTADGGQIVFQQGSAPSTITLIEIGA